MGAVKNFVMDKEAPLEVAVEYAEKCLKDFIKLQEDEDEDIVWIGTAITNFIDAVEEALDVLEKQGGADAWWFENSEILERLGPLEEKMNELLA